MKYLLDTDHISFLQKESGSEFRMLVARIDRHPEEDFALSIASFHEQLLGAHSLINRAQTNTALLRGYQLLSDILASFSDSPVLPFDTEAITTFDRLRAQRIRVATMDLRIASIALCHNLTLLTRNEKDFGKVPGLAIENWTV